MLRLRSVWAFQLIWIHISNPMSLLYVDMHIYMYFYHFTFLYIGLSACKATWCIITEYLHVTYITFLQLSFSWGFCMPMNNIFISESLTFTPLVSNDNWNPKILAALPQRHPDSSVDSIFVSRLAAKHCVGCCQANDMPMLTSLKPVARLVI